MARTRRSHVVPKFYLRGFCIPPDERLWVGDLDTGKVYCANIGDIGVVKDFYAECGPEHEDVLEERLSKIESDAAPELHKVLNGSVNIAPALSRFIAWMAARTLWLRRCLDEQLPEAMRTQPEMFLQNAGTLERPFIFEHKRSGRRETVRLPEALERVHDTEWRMRVHQDHYLDATRLQAHYFQSEHFPALKWVKATAPAGSHFLTSDRPACWDIMDTGVSNSPAVLRHPRVKLTVPLGRNTAFLAGHDLAALTRPHGPSEINAQTCSHAERFIYCCSRETVVTQMSKPRPGRRVRRQL